MDILKAYKKDRRERRRVIASDILVILVVVKFSFEYAISYQTELASFLAAIFIFAGILAIAMKLEIFRNLLSLAALLVFFVDLMFQSGPTTQMLFIILVVVSIASFFWLRLFG